jgi:hypothetical protein
MRLYHVTLVAVFHLYHTQDASACGSTPALLSALLPESDAAGVDTNAVLIASNNDGAVVFTLRRMPLPGEGEMNTAPAVDGGAHKEAPLPLDSASVTLQTTCYPAFSGNLCVATPTEPLLPNSIYEWSVAATVEGQDEPTAPSEQWRLFVTSDGAMPHAPSTVTAAVVKYIKDEGNPCGITSSVNLALEGTGLVGPVVVNVKGLTPSYVTEPKVLSPDSPQQELTLYSPPECFTLELFDGVGIRQELEEICLEAAEPEVNPVVEEPEAAPPDQAPTQVAPTMAPSETAEPVPPVDSDADDADDQEHADAKKHGIEPTSNAGCATVPGSKPLGIGALLPSTIAAAQLLRRRRHSRRLR